MCLPAGLKKALLRAMRHRPWVKLTPPHIRHDGRGCYGAGQMLQCLLLPEHKAVAKEHLAKPKGPACASRAQIRANNGAQEEVSHPPAPPKKHTYSPDF